MSEHLMFIKKYIEIYTVAPGLISWLHL